MPNAHDSLFGTLADPTRRGIFERLCREGEQTVGALTARAGISQPAVSKHLGILKRAGLVRGRREGRRTYFSAQPGALASLIDWTGQMAGALARLAQQSPMSEPLRARQDPKLLRRLLRAKDRIDAASHEAWPVQRLARVSGVSEAHFARLFRQAFGVPPHRYLLTRRVERATALLRDTDLTITEIAFEAGWQSLGTFGRTFRDVVGESPSELREREKAAGHERGAPPCFLSAARRPDLRISVSEKRRQDATRMNGIHEAEGTEVS